MPASGPLPTLCRFEGNTCAACCWGEKVPYRSLGGQLRRQTRLFARRFTPRSRPGRLDLFLHEWRVRGPADFFWGLVLLLPFVGDLLRPVLASRLTCAFLGYEDEGQKRLGCMLHPSRWRGRDLRQRSAFALLRGIGCGAPDWYCLASHFFAAAPTSERRRIAGQSRSLDWYAFSRLASRYRPPRMPASGTIPQMSTITSASQPSAVGSTRRP